ncbi:hypothetical protein DKX38_019309 [Salix brachista]|uniref:Uncharacterized protein n=1 Tax=Salix brachista TaxID=2182728 RepID=A0A5N5KFY9_9ROSI|nr:hypothetical protein DKX38_019309 [Salix brachista]
MADTKFRNGNLGMVGRHHLPAMHSIWTTGCDFPSILCLPPIWKCTPRHMWRRPQNGLLFTGGEDRNITAWDVNSGKVAYCIDDAHSARVKGIVVLMRNDNTVDDPYLLASASSDGVIRVWDLRMSMKERPNPLAEANTKSRLTCLAGSSLNLRFQLQSLKKGNLSIHDYMLKMRSLSETLASAGQLISDDELTLYILGGLGHDYDSVVVNLTSRHDQVTLQEVQYMLQSQEMRLEQLNLSTPSDTYTPNANLATYFRKSLNLQGFNNNFSNTPRNFANDRGHGKGKWGRGNRPHCQLCNRPGHIALKCYHRFDISFQGQQSSNPQHSKNPFSVSNRPAKSFSFQSSLQSLYAKSSQFSKPTLWHMRLGHPSINDTTLDSSAADTMPSQVNPGAISQHSSSDSPSPFALKTLGSVTYFLGFETTRGTDGLHLSQAKYTVDLLKRTNMLDAHPCPTPMNQSNKLHLHDINSMFIYLGTVMVIGMPLHQTVSYAHELKRSQMGASCLKEAPDAAEGE